MYQVCALIEARLHLFVVEVCSSLSLHNERMNINFEILISKIKFILYSKLLIYSIEDSYGPLYTLFHPPLPVV
jgi:hypothetical protein